MSSLKKVLVIAPHADDEVLGVGGTIVKHTSRKDQVDVVVVSDREGFEDVQRSQAAEARRILGFRGLYFLGLKDEHLDESASKIIKPMELVYEKIRPDIVYIPFYNDFNIDHQAVHKACMVVCRRLQPYPPSEVLMYEIPSSTTQSTVNLFSPNTYVSLGPADIARKAKAFLQYSDEVREMPNPRNKDGLLTYAIFRGMECGESYAEAFQSVYRKN